MNVFINGSELVIKLRNAIETGRRVDVSTDELEAVLSDVEGMIAEQQEKSYWKPIQIGSWHGFTCMNCGVSSEVPCSNTGIPQWKYCPECGSRNILKEV